MLGSGGDCDVVLVCWIEVDAGLVDFGGKLVDYPDHDPDAGYDDHDSWMIQETNEVAEDGEEGVFTLGSQSLDLGVFGFAGEEVLAIDLALG